MTIRNRILSLLLTISVVGPLWANEQDEVDALQALADGYPQVARQRLERLVNRQPERMDLRAAYASSLYQLGEAPAAKQQIEPVLAKKNPSMDTLILGIDIYRSLGDWGRAKALLKKALRRSDIPPGLYLRQANVLEAIGRIDEANAAMTHYQTLMQPVTTEGTPQ